MPKMNSYFSGISSERIEAPRSVDFCPGGYDRDKEAYLLTFSSAAFVNGAGDAVSATTLTIVWDERANRWKTKLPIAPTCWCRSGQDTLAFQSGAAYLIFNPASAYSSFFGILYAPYITFSAAPEPSRHKLFHGIRVRSGLLWYVSGCQTSGGANYAMNSLIPQNRFKALGNHWYAPFLRDTSDPNFLNIVDAPTRAATALLRGRALKGESITITLSASSGAGSMALVGADIEYTPETDSR